MVHEFFSISLQSVKKQPIQTIWAADESSLCLEWGPTNSNAVSQVGWAICTPPLLSWPHLDLAGMDGGGGRKVSEQSSAF